MYKKDNIIVITIIPTINRPKEIKKAIYSVLNQSVPPEEIIISYERYRTYYRDVEKVIEKIKEKAKFKISLIPNSRTNNLSGNINNALFYVKEKYKTVLDKAFISILDDDDEYLPNYIRECVEVIKKEDNIVAIFSPMKWKFYDEKGKVFREKINFLDEEKLNASEFFKGNPGIQGSNMFFKFNILDKIGCFDEKLISTTDRDLMVRFFKFLEGYNQKNKQKLKIKVLNKPLVIYHARKNLDRLTENIFKKHTGLYTFYKKYETEFSKEELKISLNRAKKLFNFDYKNKRRKIVIGMPFKDNFETVERAVKSVLSQKDLRRELLLLIINEGAYDKLKQKIYKFLDDPRLIIYTTNLGKISLIRNYIIDFVKDAFPDTDYIGRLDADDWIIDEFTLSKIEKIMDEHNPDVIIAGNKLSINGKIIDRINYAKKDLLKFEYLKKRLYQMSLGIPEGELPSCNVFVRSSIDVRYKDVESAEDHWFTVDLLLRKDKYKIYIAEDILYAVYSLNGQLTNKNKKSEKYIKSRKSLYEYFLNSIKRKEENHE